MEYDDKIEENNLNAMDTDTRQRVVKHLKEDMAQRIVCLPFSI
jgi:hypothetical protein